MSDIMPKPKIIFAICGFVNRQPAFELKNTICLVYPSDPAIKTPDIVEAVCDENVINNRL